MPASVRSLAASLREGLAGFDPAVLSGDDCALLAEELATTEKACAAAGLLATKRAVEAGVHRQMGFKDGAAWLARQSGTTGTHARQALDTAGRLDDCPDTKEAFVNGQISLAQAAEITQAESDSPGAEATLLPGAGGSDLTRLREKAREHRQATTPAKDLHAQQHAARFFRHWTNRIGNVCGAFELPPEQGLPFIRRIERAAWRSRRDAKQSNRSNQPNQSNQTATKIDRFEAFAADALAGLVAPQGPAKAGPRADLVIVADLYAWRRGHTHPGEVCHIIDGGPIPVDLAKELGRDAFVSVVLHDGVAIHTVKRFGRHLPAELRTALDLGPVPAFTGRQCVDCGQRWDLEYDHDNPVANLGPTSYDNLVPRCYKDHRIKTERDRKAGLLGPHARARPPDTS